MASDDVAGNVVRHVQDAYSNPHALSYMASDDAAGNILPSLTLRGMATNSSPWTQSRQGLADIACHVIGCRLTMLVELSYCW